MDVRVRVAFCFPDTYEIGMSNQDKKSSNNEFIGEAGEQGSHIVTETKSVYHMFLEDEGIVDENNDRMEAEDGIPLAMPGEIYVTKVERTKVYDSDIVKDSKNNFNLEKRITNIYKDRGNTILSNDLF